jgi:hypothetical protein
MSEVISIKFKADKNGNQMAYKWHNSAMRWVRMSLLEAELLFHSDDIAVEIVSA